MSLIGYRKLGLLPCWASACPTRPPHHEVTAKPKPTKHLKSCKMVQSVTAALARTSMDVHTNTLKQFFYLDSTLFKWWIIQYYKKNNGLQNFHRHKTKGLVTLAKFLPSFFNNVAMYEALLIQQSLSNQVAFFFGQHPESVVRPTWILNILQNLRGEIFHPHMKFSIMWTPIKMTGFHPQKFTEIC